MTRNSGGFAAVLVAGLLLTGLLAGGCQPGRTEDSSETPPAGQGSSEPWTLVDVQPDTADGIRVLVLHDMEGLSGQDNWRSFDFGMPEYPHGRQLLAADINAVVEGLFAGGATEVNVVDGHGSGNPDPDLRADLLDERASQVLRDEPFDTYFDMVEPGAYDAVAVVGMHAKTGSRGFASHTFTLGMDILINGQSITETELVALSWGRVDVPVIFGSGDDRLAADLETMPWIEFVTVKRATSASTAEPRPVDEARAELRDGARKAVENLASAKVMRVSKPIRATLRAVPPASLRLMEGFPGVDYVDNTVSFVTDDLRETYDGLVAIIGVATRSYPSVLFDLLRARADADAVFDAYNVALTERWLDVESGRWSPDEPAESPTSPGRKYHGYR